MSLFRVNVVARNPKDESQETPPIEALVETGSELTWLIGANTLLDVSYLRSDVVAADSSTVLNVPEPGPWDRLRRAARFRR